MGPPEGLPDVSCHTVEGIGSRGQAVLREGKGRDTLELQHCPTGVISLHLGNSWRPAGRAERLLLKI